MKSSVNISLIGLLVLLLGACSPVRVFLEKDQLAAASTYKTFMVENERPGKPVYGSPELDKELQQQLIEGMEKRGFVLDINDPDIILRYNTILSQNQKEINTMAHNPWGWGMYNPYMWRYPYSYPYHYGRGGYKVEKYNLGEVVIGFIDAEKEEEILRISAVGEVTKPKQLDKNVKVSVDRILTEFNKKVPSS